MATIDTLNIDLTGDINNFEGAIDEAVNLVDNLESDVQNLDLNVEGSEGVEQFNDELLSGIPVVGKFSDKLGGLGNSAKSLVGRLGPVGVAVGAISAALAGAGVAAVALTTKITKLTLAISDQQKELVRFSNIAGVATQDFAALNTIGRRFGADANDTADALLNVNEKLSDLRKNQGPLVDLLSQTSVNMQKLAESESTVEFLDNLNQEMADLDGTTKRAAASIVLGEEGMRQFGSVLLNSNKNISDTKKEMRDLGIIFSDEANNSFQNISDASNTISRSLTGVKNAFISEVAPAVEFFITKAAAAAKILNQTLIPAIEATGDRLGEVGTSFINAGESAQGFFASFSDGFSIFPATTTAAKNQETGLNKLNSAVQNSTRAHESQSDAIKESGNAMSETTKEARDYQVAMDNLVEATESGVKQFADFDTSASDVATSINSALKSQITDLQTELENLKQAKIKMTDVIDIANVDKAIANIEAKMLQLRARAKSLTGDTSGARLLRERAQTTRLQGQAGRADALGAQRARGISSRARSMAGGRFDGLSMQFPSATGAPGTRGAIDELVGNGDKVNTFIEDFNKRIENLSTASSITGDLQGLVNAIGRLPGVSNSATGAISSLLGGVSSIAGSIASAGGMAALGPAGIAGIAVTGITSIIGAAASAGGSGRMGRGADLSTSADRKEFGREIGRAAGEELKEDTPNRPIIVQASPRQSRSQDLSDRDIRDLTDRILQDIGERQ